MPLIYPASVISEMKKMGGAFGDIALLDIEARDGTRYYLTDVGGDYPCAFDGTTQTYKPWIKSAGPLRMTSDFRTDAGDITLQNLSGNSIDREVVKTLAVDREFENSLAIFRLWIPLADYAIREHHGTLTDQRGDWEELSFRLAQLFDTNQFYVADDVYSASCTWFYKGKRCGSVSGLASCDKTIPNCAARNARERFNGSPTPPPNYLYTTTISGGGGTGGQGKCFSGNTRIKTPGGVREFKSLPIDGVFAVLNRRGESRNAKLLVHRHKGTMVHMGNTELVTPDHLLDFGENDYRAAGNKYTQRVQFEGKVYNLHIVDPKDETERHYCLENGEIAHNFKEAPKDSFDVLQ